MNARAPGVAVVAVAAALLTTACAPKHQRVCNASANNRADGKYENLTPSQADKYSSDYGYACASACYELHETDKPLAEILRAPVCIESDLLVADEDPITGAKRLKERCDGGHAWACAWLEKNQTRIADATARRERQSAAAAARSEQLAAERAANPPPEQRGVYIPEDPAAVDRAAELMIKAALNNGFGVQGDDTLRLGSTGSVSMNTPSPRG